MGFGGVPRNTAGAAPATPALAASRGRGQKATPDPSTHSVWRSSRVKGSLRRVLTRSVLGLRPVLRCGFRARP